eukprot:TRINITY_DN17662_c0_g1_i1.p1 TRINITY_DN17662_c0_g1~~TRINITY_DN17662_c0_g1_i1.p1  ORF type:complete len:542 (+),score=90.94 TRINITY_DN17662_c0_g1_i1:90-1715(+)
MGCAASGSRDANSFHAAVRHGSFLPPTSSITYQGLFNQHSYYAGPPEDQALVALESRTAWVGSRPGQHGDDAWVGCFLKSCRDGRPRDATPIDVVVVLDISGSMNGFVGEEGNVESDSVIKTRLTLAKEALCALLNKLRDDDRFGLATFTNVGSVVQTLDFVSTLDLNGLSKDINALSAGGGTILQAGMQAAVGICKDAVKLTERRHRRLLFLTDMDDLGASQLDEMIATQASDGLYVSIVGIGMAFNSKLADEVTRHKGANYFCITREEELSKVMVDDFDWNFFPAAFEVEVAFQSDAFILDGVYGTPFETKDETVSGDWKPQNHQFYSPEFKERAKELLLCSLRSSHERLPNPALQQTLSYLSSEIRTVVRVDTVFPSAVNSDGSVEGGLILLRLKPRGDAVSAGHVRLMLSYVTSDGDETSKCNDLEIVSKQAASAVAGPDPAVAKGVLLQRYAEVCRGYLAAAENQQQLDVPPLRTSLAHIENLLAVMQAAPEEADALCPCVRAELVDFALMARKHFEKIAPADDVGEFNDSSRQES